MKKRYIGAGLTAFIALNAPDIIPQDTKDTTWSQPAGAIAPAKIPDTAPEQPSALSTQHVINVGALAAKGLSPAVQQELDSVAKVVVKADRHVLHSSAVAIDGAYLSAGHAFRIPNGKGDLLRSCDEATVIGARPHGGSYKVSIPRALTIQTDRGQSMDISNAADATDISLIPKAPAGNTADLTPTNKDMPVGTRLTFVGYPPKSGQERNPSHTDDSRFPAVFEGFVVKDPPGDTSQITVVTGVGKSYGKLSDNTGRGGISGGAVLSDDGIVRGTIAGATDYGFAGPKLSDVESWFGVDVQNANNKGGYAQLMYIQPVNGALVAGIPDDSRAGTFEC